MTATLGIIGLGEAGAAIATGLVEQGVAVTGFDARFADPAAPGAPEGVRPAPSLGALIEASDIVLCLTSAKAAAPIAAGAAAHLRPGQLYSDWNSAGPALKRSLATTVEAAGARFVDGAVLAAVPPERHAVPVLLSGPAAAELAAELTGLGMNMEVVGTEPGQASAIKMFRSLLVKGLESLLLEFAAGAERYGVTGRVLDSLNGSLPIEDWPELARYLMERSVRHGDRRAEELRQVAATLRECGVAPLVAGGAAERLARFAGSAARRAAAGERLDYPRIVARMTDQEET